MQLGGQLIRGPEPMSFLAKMEFWLHKNLCCSVQANVDQVKARGARFFFRKTWDLRTNLQEHSSIDWSTTSCTVTTFIQIEGQWPSHESAVTGHVPHLAELPGAYRLVPPLFWRRYYKQEPKTKILQITHR